MSRARRRQMVDREHPKLSVVRQVHFARYQPVIGVLPPP